MQMRVIVFILFICTFIILKATGQVSLTNVSSSVTIDFSNTTPSTVGTNPSTAFSGTGFEPNPTTAGRLNSNAWAVTGLSDGNLSFGGTQTAALTDYTRGSTAVAVTNGGIYAFTGYPGSVANPSLMFQPGADDWTPGNITLRIQNNGTGVINQLAVIYDLYVRNDQERSNSFNFSYSTDDVSYTSVSALDYTSAAVADGLGWVLVGSSPSRSTTITSLSVLPGEYLYLRWSGNDVGGSGSRDEFGLDNIEISATFGAISTDYYRSVTTGNWSNPSTWQSSPDNITWGAASTPPTSLSNTITIQSGHIVTIDAPTSADQLTIVNGGTLNHTAGVSFSVNNGTGTDMVVNGTYILNGSQPSGTGTIQIPFGGIVRVDANSFPNLSDDFAYGNANVSFLTGSIYDWNASGFTPQWSGRTYFSAGQNVTFRFSVSPNFDVGGGSPTVIYGVLEVNADIQIAGNSIKSFVNGILGSANITTDPSFSSVIEIAGDANAILGGTGIIDLSGSSASIVMGPSVIVSMTSSKTIIGSVTLFADSYVELNTYNLTVSGNISGGTTNAYVRTSSTGSLILNSIDAAGKTFPVGHSQYNPILIENGSNHNWSVNVNDGVIADPPRGVTGAVSLTWNISPSVNPPAAGAEITFQFDKIGQVGINFNTPPYNTPDNVQAWHRSQGYWLAAGTPTPLTLVGGNVWKVKVTGLTQFSPYALSRISLPLPVKLIEFNVNKVSSGSATVSWVLESHCLSSTLFEVEKSYNGINFNFIGSLHGSENSRHYFYIDSRLTKGTTWYRLKITEVDGRITYSKVVAIINDTKGLLITSVYPNPVSNTTNITLSAARSGMADLQVFDISGTVVYRRRSAITEGTNNLPLDLGKLPAGVYHLSVQSTESKAVYPLVKQ
jgi:hypothetical protein